MNVSSVTFQAQRLASDFSLSPVTAAEIEFYLPGSDGCPSLPVFWDAVRAACAEAAISLYHIEKERGREQHEIALMPCPDAAKTAQDIAALKAILGEAAPRYGMQAEFAAKPYPDQPGSGLHVHVHLADAQGRNVFFKDNERMSDALAFSIGGLLEGMTASMPIFAPQEASYARFAPGGNTPTTVSWGANNRTVAVRLPDAAHDRKRIEHRVAGSDADPLKVMAVLLAAMHDGLTRRIAPGPQIYGDAALPIYGLPKLPHTFEQAREQLRVSSFIFIKELCHAL